MSGLAAVLAGRERPGVYRWEAAFDLDDVRRAAQTAQWSFGHVSGWADDSKAGFLDAVGGALGFPEYYGRNLDALHDSLRDLAGPTLLLWDGWGPFARADSTAFSIVLEVFGERAADPERPAFTVLLRGAGPETSVPLLD